MSPTNQYSCKVFLKNLRIQQEIVIDNETQIMPSDIGYTCYDPASYMVNYLETVTGENVNIDIENLVKRYSKDVPVSVIKLWNIRAPTLHSAGEITTEKSQPIIKFLAYNQGQSPEAFGVTTSRKDEGQYISVYPPNVFHWKIHLMDDINAMARNMTTRLEKDEKLELFLSLFADAVEEQKLDFKIVNFGQFLRLWQFLTINITSKMLESC